MWDVMGNFKRASSKFKFKFAVYKYPSFQQPLETLLQSLPFISHEYIHHSLLIISPQ
jgi:hypothetical protein